MWYFFSPKVIFGEDALNYMEKIVGEKCFIIADKNIEELGFVKILTDKLDQYGKKYEIFLEVQPDPHEEDIMKGKDQCIAYAPDIIIAPGETIFIKGETTDRSVKAAPTTFRRNSAHIP